jgi:hypothetical protein
MTLRMLGFVLHESMPEGVMPRQYRFWLLSLVMLTLFDSNSLVGNSLIGAQKLMAPADVEPLVGNWTLEPAKSGADSAERRVVTLGPGWMRVEIHRPSDDRPPTLIYNLDGSPNVSPFGAGTARTEIRRDADAIVTVALITINDRPVTVQERLKMSPAGEMVVAVTVRVEHGYEGVLAPLESRAPNLAETVKYFRRAP